MKKKQKIKRSKKIRNTVVVCSLFAILLSASTYAWFIGMKTVSVDKFDIDNLEASLLILFQIRDIVQGRLDRRELDNNLP